LEGNDMQKALMNSRREKKGNGREIKETGEER
jgi:hypothetical protein